MSTLNTRIAELVTDRAKLRALANRIEDLMQQMMDLRTKHQLETNGLTLGSDDVRAFEFYAMQELDNLLAETRATRDERTR